MWDVIPRLCENLKIDVTLNGVFSYGTKIIVDKRFGTQIAYLYFGDGMNRREMTEVFGTPMTDKANKRIEP